jgi:virulence-associated protein VapD
VAEILVISTTFKICIAAIFKHFSFIHLNSSTVKYAGMSLSIQNFPTEVISSIIAKLRTLERVKSLTSEKVTSTYDDLRPLRFTCRLFSIQGAVYLLESIPLSTDTADWTRITAILKSSALALCVRRVVYRTWVYLNPYDTIQDYADGLLSRNRTTATNSSIKPDLGNTLFKRGVGLLWLQTLQHKI